MSHSNTSTGSARSPFSNSSTSGNKSSNLSSKKFTSIMRDRQARSKNPKTGRPSSDDDDDDDDDSTGASASKSKSSSGFSVQDDSYESIERRRWAAEILDSPELLMMHAQSRGDSVPGTRQHFTKILCGYDEPKPKEKRRRSKDRTGFGHE